MHSDCRGRGGTWAGLMWRSMQRPDVARPGTMAAVGCVWQIQVTSRGQHAVHHRQHRNGHVKALQRQRRVAHQQHRPAATLPGPLLHRRETSALHITARSYADVPLPDVVLRPGMSKAKVLDSPAVLGRHEAHAWELWEKLIAARALSHLRGGGGGRPPWQVCL